MPKKRTQTKKATSRKSRTKSPGKRTTQNLREKEQKVVKGLRDVHLMTEGQMKKHYGLTQYAIDQLYKNKILNKVTEIQADGKKSTAYELGSKGEKYVRQQLGLRHFYKSSSFSHDLKLARNYLKLTEQQRESWKTEAENRERYEEQLQESREHYLSIQQDISRTKEERDYAEEMLDKLLHCSSVDGTYTNEQGIEVSIEIVGQYSDAQVEAKANFCEVMGIQWNSIR